MIIWNNDSGLFYGWRQGGSVFGRAAIAAKSNTENLLGTAWSFSFQSEIESIQQMTLHDKISALENELR